MFEELFKYRAVIERHRNAPLVAERERYLRQRQQAGQTTETLIRIARELLCVATRLEMSSGAVTWEQISAVADTWAFEQQQKGRAKTDKWSRLLFVSVATDWCRFLGFLVDDSVVDQPEAFANELIHFADWLKSERGLSEHTIVHYTWYIRDLLRWSGMRGCQLCDIRPLHIDQYLSDRSLTGWSRVSTADAVCALRVFFRHASREG